MARSTPSTYTDDDDNLYDDSIRFEEEDDNKDSRQMFLSSLQRGGQLNSSVRFSRDVDILDRLDSIDTADYRSDESSHHHNNNNDDSAFDIGYSLSARDLLSLHDQEE
jgi:hypothetical protein